MFLDGAARELYREWDRCAAEMVATLRMDAGRNPDDRLLNELVGELTIKSPEFRSWWADHNVRETLQITDRAYIIVDGGIIKQGSPQELAADPRVRDAYLGEAFQLP